MTTGANRIEGITAGDPVHVDGTVAVSSFGTTIDVSDRAARLLGAIQGDVANDGVNTGNPVQVGGRASVAVPTDVSADGDRVAAWLTRNGARVTVIGSTVNAADAASNVEQRLFPLSAASTEKLGVHPYIFNGTTWDRLREATGSSATALGILAAGAMMQVPGGTSWQSMRGDSNSGLLVGLNRPTLLVPVTPAANAGATLTLPSGGAGNFHYITHIFINRQATAALAGGALLQVTTTNLNGLTWRTGNQASITVDTADGMVLADEDYVHPLRSAVAATATTIVLPAPGVAVSWTAWVAYYIGP